MKSLLWFLFSVFTVLPVVTYLVYYYRRLDTRRKQLLQTLLSLSLHEEYMLMRYKDKFSKWKKCPNEETLITDFENSYFNEDFRAGHSHPDFVWPVMLFTIFTAIGWLFTLQRVLSTFVAFELRSIPDALAYGFIGAYLACILAIFDGVRRYDLSPSLYYSVTYRLMFSSFAAYVVGLTFDAPFEPLVALGVGLFPLERTWNFITERAANALGAGQNEKEPGLELANIQGLEHSTNRQKLTDIGISTVQGLATADPLLVFFLTTFPLRTVVDMIDKAILYLYLGDDVVKLRKHGVNGVIELVALARLADGEWAYKNQQGKQSLGKLYTDFETEKLISALAEVIGQSPNEFKAFIYNMECDPMVNLIYEIWGRYLQRPIEQTLTDPQTTLQAKPELMPVKTPQPDP